MSFFFKFSQVAEAPEKQPTEGPMNHAKGELAVKDKEHSLVISVLEPVRKKSNK